MLLKVILCAAAVAVGYVAMVWFVAGFAGGGRRR